MKKNLLDGNCKLLLDQDMLHGLTEILWVHNGAVSESKRLIRGLSDN